MGNKIDADGGSLKSGMKYMLIAIEDVINEAVDDGGFSNSLVPEEDNFIFEERRDSSLAEVEVAYVGHYLEILN